MGRLTPKPSSPSLSGPACVSTHPWTAGGAEGFGAALPPTSARTVHSPPPFGRWAGTEARGCPGTTREASLLMRAPVGLTGSALVLECKA